jgi:signal transduction histidine kinase/DNA-binding response OmpR family regulator/streptogramin lyase
MKRNYLFRKYSLEKTQSEKNKLIRAVQVVKIIVFLLLIHLSFGQESTIIFNKLDTRNGLASNFVHNIAADSSGFVWFATSSGLDKYDGTSFKHYKAEPENPYGLKSNMISKLIIDKKNRLWVIAQTGISRYVPEYDHFINYYTADSNYLSVLPPEKIFEDSKGNFWLCFLGQANICFFDLNEDKIMFKLSPSKMKQLGVEEDSYLIKCIDSDDNIWIGGIKSNTHYCIEKNDTNLRVIDSVQGNFRKDIDLNPSISIIFEDSRGDLYFANHGLFLGTLNSSRTRQFKHIDLFDGKKPSHINDFLISRITEDEIGRLWISTAKYGVKIYNPVNKKISSYKPLKSSELNSFNYEHINPDVSIKVFRNNVLKNIEPGVDKLSIFKEVDKVYNTSVNKNNTEIVQSKDGTYWLNTPHSGVIYFNPYYPQFELFKRGKGNNSLRGSYIWGIYEDHKGRLWVGTNGVDMYDPSSKKFHHFNEDNNKNYIDLKGNVSALFEINPNEFLIAASAYLHWYKFDNDKLIRLGEFKPEGDNPNSLANWMVFRIFKDSKGIIWLGTFNGISAWELPDNKNSQGKFTNYYFDIENSKGKLHSPSVWNFYEDSKERIWICTKGRLIQLDSSRKDFTSIFPKLPNGDSLINCFPECILEYPTGIFWIATEGFGLFRYIESKNEFKLYNTTYGFPTNKLYSVLNDSSGKLWLSSDKGLIRFNPEQETIETFTVSDGLQGNLFFSGSYHLGKFSGKFYFGGSNGLNAFNPEKIKKITIESSVYFSGLRVNNQLVKVDEAITDHVILPKDLNFLDEIILKHNQNNFSIGFSSIQFSSPEKTMYKYILEGADHDWTQTSGNNTSANYSHLKHGNYTFKIKSIGRNGKWIQPEKIIRIKILPPWWLTWWAKILYAMVFITIIYFSQRYILLKVNYAKRIELEEAKTNFFMNISHEFRTPLTLIIDPLERLLSAQRNNPLLQERLTLVLRNAKRLNRLVNQLLELRRPLIANEKVNMIKADIKDFLERIIESFKQLSEGNNIKYELLWKDNMISETPIYFDPDKLEKIMYNLISNAFKFTHDGGSIRIIVDKFTESKDGFPGSINFLQITVTDTGVGISKKDIPHIFKRYYRVNSRANNTQSGVGIGLSLTKELVEKLNGTISVLSEEKKGTSFKIQIPCSPLFPETTEDLSEKYLNNNSDIFYQESETNNTTNISDNFELIKDKKQPSNNKQLTILVVDDNSDIRLYIRKELAIFYNIIEAENGETGLKATLNHIPDLIISDVMMPVMNGIEFCSKVKENIITSHIPVIILTARSSERNIIEGLNNGSDDYIAKPFSLNILQLKIKNILRTRSNLIAKFKEEIDTPAIVLGQNNIDKDFLLKIENIVNENLSEPQLDVVFLSEQLSMSRSYLFKKMKALSGQTPGDFIKTMRLKKAAVLIKTTNKNISEIAYALGYSSPSNFSRAFATYFNTSPTEYAEMNKVDKFNT